VTPNEWDLESEISRLTGAHDLYEGLRRLRIIEGPDARPEVIRDPEWVRGGAETYIYRFWIRGEGDHSKGYIIKACAAFSFALSLEGLLESWVSRRLLLSSAGASTPELFACKQGVIIEELIPFSMLEVLRHAVGKNRDHMLYSLASLAAIYSAYGFAPIDGYSDLRSRGSDVVIVDFGQDLGPAGVLPRGDYRVLEHLLTSLLLWEIEVGREQERKISQIFSRYQKKFTRTKERTN
jgi:hypothetical protein